MLRCDKTTAVMDRMVPETRYAKTLDGGYIAYKILGDGEVDVAIIGSIATNIELFMDFEPAARSWFDLASSARVTLHDRRGTGLSDDMGGLPNLETRAADLPGGARCCGPGAAVSARGRRRWHGGQRCWPRLAPIGWPVWSGFRPPHGRWPATGGRTDETQSTVEALAEAAETGWGSAAFVRQMYPGMAMDAEAVEFLATMQRHACGPATAVGFIQLLNEYDVRDVLPTLRLPVLVVAPQGSTDDWLYRQAEATAQLIEGAVFHPLPPEALRLWHPSVIHETRAFLGIEHPPPSSTPCSRRCCSPTSSIPPTIRRGSAIEPGRRWSNSITRSSAGHSTGGAALEVDTAGDGFFASFDGPARAIRCALEISQKLGELGIRIRAGVHTGECELINGKIGGITVSIGARVAGRARPTEVYVSQTVKDLVAGSGLSFDPRGEEELKGVPGRWRLYSAHERS